MVFSFVFYRLISGLWFCSFVCVVRAVRVVEVVRVVWATVRAVGALARAEGVVRAVRVERVVWAVGGITILVRDFYKIHLFLIMCIYFHQLFYGI